MRPAVAAAWLAAALIAGGLPAAAQTTPSAIAEARLVGPTDRYDHAVLGDALEWAALELRLADGSRRVFSLPRSAVFEDVAARLADLDGDGQPEVVVVETDLARGASLAVYGPQGKIAATPHIGRRHRWLAPAGIGDLDGDGRVEIAYVDRPHLARELVMVRLQGGRLVEIARAPGFTNHAIGDAEIAGGLRRCGGSDALVLADAAVTRAMLVRLGPGGVGARPLGPIAGLADLAPHLACP
jgi:hypothetical protein